MKINNNPTIHTKSFKAVPISNIKIAGTEKIETNLKVFQITCSDKLFLNNLSSSIDLKKLMPRLPEVNLEVWENIFRKALAHAKDRTKKALLLTNEDKCCGIITYSPKPQKYYVDYICTWPVEKNTKVPLAGKTLMAEMFKLFLNDSAQTIELNAIKNGPFDTISKYISLGFKPVGGDNYSEVMRCNRERAFQTIQKLKDSIISTAIENPKDLNLFEILK